MKVLIISVIILFFANSLAFSQYNTDSSFKYISKYKNGNIKSEGNLLYGVEDGLWKFYNKDGKIIQSAYFYEGTLNGKVEKFYENGQIMIETYYYYGLQVSKYNEWYENGKQKIKGFYKSAFKDSLWTYYNEKGNKIKQELYDYRADIPMLLNLWDKSGTQTVITERAMLLSIMLLVKKNRKVNIPMVTKMVNGRIGTLTNKNLLKVLLKMPNE